jgi:hypothetical protein
MPGCSAYWGYALVTRPKSGPNELTAASRQKLGTVRMIEAAIDQT